MFFAGPVRADDLEEFLAAYEAYASADYSVAVERFRPLVDQDPPRLRSDLFEAALGYYGASLLLADRESEAVQVFERLLRRNPDAQLSTREFSPLVIQVFLRTRQRLATELARLREERAAMERAARADRERRQRLLIDWVTRERVVRRSPPRFPTMFLPFGVGQFVNGDVALGWTFLGAETALMATAVTSIGLQLARCPPTPCPERVAEPFLTVERIAWGLLAITAVAGIVQGNLAYQAERVEYRRRPLPPGFEPFRLSVGFAGDGAGLGARLLF